MFGSSPLLPFPLPHPELKKTSKQLALWNRTSCP
ncbi:unnamed protein product [Strongylus vulgaris]|uniref:Uncharacterized protein n=1 Tax=Strongylus vulgaris TaxID=40348 RepID=A0A3P7M2Z2_STRVU|nr:unnamed protein product [Strongylus vulgaris]